MFFGCPVTQFCGDDDAGANLRFANVADVLRHLSLRVADKIGDDVGVEQVAHHRSTGSGCKSGMGGKSSSSGASVANTASRDSGGAGSMISRSPSLRIIASAPGNSNSRGIR